MVSFRLRRGLPQTQTHCTDRNPASERGVVNLAGRDRLKRLIDTQCGDWGDHTSQLDGFANLFAPKSTTTESGCHTEVRQAGWLAWSLGCGW